MRRIATALPLLAVICASPALASGLTVVRHLNGYQCMSLNLSDQAMMNPSTRIPIKAGPSPASATIGNAIATVIARQPETLQNGYVSVLFLTGRPGWVQAQYLKPWRNPGTSGQRCVPAVMSNGRLGFDYQ